jgi:hypothetical protein
VAAIVITGSEKAFAGFSFPVSPMIYQKKA